MKTELEKSGYGIGVGTSVKAIYFKKDLEKLLKAYDVTLRTHPFSDCQDIFIIDRGSSYVDGHAKIN